MLYYERINVIEGIDINKTNASSKKLSYLSLLVFFYIRGLSSNQMSAIGVTMY